MRPFFQIIKKSIRAFAMHFNRPLIHTLYIHIYDKWIVTTSQYVPLSILNEQKNKAGHLTEAFQIGFAFISFRFDLFQFVSVLTSFQCFN